MLDVAVRDTNYHGGVVFFRFSGEKEGQKKKDKDTFTYFPIPDPVTELGGEQSHALKVHVGPAKSTERDFETHTVEPLRVGVMDGSNPLRRSIISRQQQQYGRICGVSISSGGDDDIIMIEFLRHGYVLRG